jgi:molybdopterin-binding protein
VSSLRKVNGGSVNSAVTIRDLRFSYTGNDPFLFVDDLSLPPGRIIVLIGDNGCGKTTLLKLLAGLLKPDGGTITYSDDAPPLLVHQRPYLFAESVRANVGWPLKIRHLPRREVRTRVAAALKTVGLSHLERRWAPFLSGGEKQRAAIARALVLSPTILLLDEPTSNIDASSVEVVESVLRRLSATGTTVIMSTHNLASAYRLADRILPMNAGRLVPVHVNVLPGLALDPGHEHIGRFQIDMGPEIYCPAMRGTLTRAIIRMEDIILSAGEMTSSAQNRLRGLVTAVVPTGSELARVELDCGFPLTAVVTHRSVEEMGIIPGTEVFASFKASAVQLF